MVLIEICVDDPAGAAVAARNGASRIELCADLGCGGVTPSTGLMSIVRQSVEIPIIALIRPRPGDFVYRDEELRAMLVDIGVARDCGVQGVAVGALTSDGRWHRDHMSAMAEAAEGIELVCHRAFDRCVNQEDALGDLVDWGFQRVLTSGGQPSALDGAEPIGRWIERVDGAIEILPAAGIRSENVDELLVRTKANQVHASASGWREQSRPSRVRMGVNETDRVRITDGAEVLALVSAARG